MDKLTVKFKAFGVNDVVKNTKELELAVKFLLDKKQTKPKKVANGSISWEEKFSFVTSTPTQLALPYLLCEVFSKELFSDSYVGVILFNLTDFSGLQERWIPINGDQSELKISITKLM
eukprot:TRINITY_DN411_c0_g4_i2.p1 TRINITY_DN411_c0_g4~~TRINITY_DN411_c0_g4_i2.p1  ORF type:complete len:118 (+),score=26.86 TRINITY_DN411_c0_g4_i2:1633-1986(+)